MTEQEAKSLASELEHHHLWRVAAVREYSSMRWGIELELRANPALKSYIYGTMSGYILHEMLSMPIRQ